MGNTSSNPSYPENDYQLIRDLAVDIEDRLRNDFSATGKGIHELLDSVHRPFPKEITGPLRYIAHVRNSWSHDKNPCNFNRFTYIKKYEEVVKHMDSALNPPTSTRDESSEEGSGILMKSLAIGVAALAVGAVAANANRRKQYSSDDED